MVGCVANAMEQSLLLPKDMVDLRSIRKHEVFLGLKRDLAMVRIFLIFNFLIMYLLFSRPFKPLLGLKR